MQIRKEILLCSNCSIIIREILHDSRKGIRISQDDFKQINEIISPLIKDKGQSLNHILTSHTEIDVSERTLRNWINYRRYDIGQFSYNF